MDDAVSEVTYRTINLYADEERYIYFYADPPHLVKTARNCLRHSGPQRTRRMETGDGFLLWEHVRAFVLNDINCDSRKRPRLSLEHINLTPYSTMKVKLAAQVLSLKKDYPRTLPATAKYCPMFNNNSTYVISTKEKGREPPFSIPTPAPTIGDSPGWRTNF